MENFNQSFLSIQYRMNDGMSREKVKLLNDYLKKINIVYAKESSNFADLCYYVYQVKSLFIGDFCWDMKNRRLQFKDIMSQYNIDETEQSRLCACYNKYFEFSMSDDGKKVESYKIKDEFFGFSKSKLYELLQIDNDQIIIDLKNNVLRYDFSVKQIRDYVKNIKALEKQQKKLYEKEEEIVTDVEVEEIPPAYNPQQHYDFEYFESKSKSQLLNIVWEKQKAYEKLENEYKKLKKEIKNNP